MPAIRRLIALALTLALVAPATVMGADPVLQPNTPPSNPPNPADEVLVRYRPDTSVAERRGVARELGLDTLRSSADARTQVVVGRGRSTATVRRLLLEDSRVLAVAPNFYRELADDITAEPYFPYQWGFHNTGQKLSGTTTQTGIADVDIDGLEALRITHGSPDIVVAVIDDGVDFVHPELTDRAWTNPGEAGGLATNGVDDDGNGHIDDVHGWDFCHDDRTLHDEGPDGPHDGHGTHVAGTIAASLDGQGVVGVAPGIQIMALKFIEDGQPCGTDEMAIAAIDYAASFGVPIINASWGGENDSAVLEAAIAESGALFVAAAGNGVHNGTTSVGQNLDGPYDFYPAEYGLANIVSVAAIDQRGNRAGFSNYGATTVDIAAPGTNVISTYPYGWAWSAGTSMAAPHVSGVAALAASVMEGETTATLKARVLDRGVALAGVATTTSTGRLVNAARVLDVAGPVALPVERQGFNVGVSVGTTVSTTLVWPPATDDLSGVASYVVTRRIGSGAWATAASAVATGKLKQTLTIGSGYRFGIAGRDRVGNVGTRAESPVVTASLFQDATSLAKYTGTWSTVASTSASGKRLHRTSRAGASVTFTTSLRAVAVVARKNATNGQAKVYVDGAYVQTINLYRSSPQSKIVVFNKSWPTNGVHTVKIVAVGTAGHPGVDIDAFAILR